MSKENFSYSVAPDDLEPQNRQFGRNTDDYEYSLDFSDEAMSEVRLSDRERVSVAAAYLWHRLGLFAAKQASRCMKSAADHLAPYENGTEHVIDSYEATAGGLEVAVKRLEECDTKCFVNLAANGHEDVEEDLMRAGDGVARRLAQEFWGLATEAFGLQTDEARNLWLAKERDFNPR